MALDLLVLWVAITNWMSAHLLAKRGVVNLGRSPEGGALVGMQVPCRHERSRRTEHSDGTLSHHQLVPVVGPPNLPARGTYPHLLTPGGLGRSALLRARRQHPDRDRRIGPGDPLPVEGWHRIDRAGRVPRTRARDHRRRDRRGVGLRFLCLAGCSVLEPNSSNQCLRPSAGWLHSRGSGVLGCDRKPQSVCAARGSRQMGILDLCCGHRERILRRLPPSPQPPIQPCAGSSVLECDRACDERILLRLKGCLRHHRLPQLLRYPGCDPSAGCLGETLCLRASDNPAAGHGRGSHSVANRNACTVAQLGDRTHAPACKMILRVSPYL